jgi:hypothetical protein
VRLADTELTDAEGNALISEFGIDELCGTCGCSGNELCPLCNDDLLDDWLRKRRMAELGLRVINGGANGRANR